MTFHYRYRKQIILGISLVIVLATTISSIIYFYEPKKEKKIEKVAVEKIKK